MLMFCIKILYCYIIEKIICFRYFGIWSPFLPFIRNSLPFAYSSPDVNGVKDETLKGPVPLPKHKLIATDRTRVSPSYCRGLVYKG